VNISKKSLLSFILIIAMVLTFGALSASCGGDKEEGGGGGGENPGGGGGGGSGTPASEEPETIGVTVKLTIPNLDESHALYDDLSDFDLFTELTDVPSKLTVIAATQQICTNMGMPFSFDGLNVSIGGFTFTVVEPEEEEEEEYVAPEIEYDEDGNPIEPEDPVEEEPKEEPKATISDWDVYATGEESSTGTLIGDGDLIEWVWTEGIEFEG